MSDVAVRTVPVRGILPVVFKADRALVAINVLLMTIGAPMLARLGGWPAWPLLLGGLVMIPYLRLLHRIVALERFTGRSARMTMQMDFAWVILSVVALVFFRDLSTTAGNWIIAGLAAVVLDVGLAKWIGMRRSTAASSTKG